MDWIIGCSEDDGTIHPVYDTTTRTFPTGSTKWSRRPLSYQAKLSLCFLNLFALTGELRYKATALRILDAAIANQHPHGFFLDLCNGNDGLTAAHPHLYAAEGLWVAAIFLHRADYLLASHKATAWILRQYHTMLSLPPAVQSADEQLRTDAIGQTIRLACLHNIDLKPRGSACTRGALIRALLASQCKAADPRAAGGFHFGGDQSAKGATHVNSWATLFAVQALQLASDKRHRRKAFDPFDLV